MGEPVTTGMMIGAAGGALTNKNPIQGAMMGGALGAAGGAFTGGAMGVTNPTVGSFAPDFMSTGAVTQSASAPTFMQRLGGGFTGVKDAFSGANTFLNQNPIASQTGINLAQNAFAPEQQMAQAPAGQISRGQIQGGDYMSLLNPQQSPVLRPQPISLLG
jgi:hypothetical protein